MLLAADRLENTADSISMISESLGYQSDSAFSTAFKRVMGSSPRDYSHRPASRKLLAGRSARLAA
jgi:AraC-like DNA-binding protein